MARSKVVAIQKECLATWGEALQQFLWWKQAQGVSKRTLPKLKESANFFAVFGVFFAIEFFQRRFFKQYLTVKQPKPKNKVNQKYPVREDQKYSYQDKPESSIYRVTAVRKNSGCNKLSRILLIKPDTKALPERN
jgi:hypothetical protein